MGTPDLAWFKSSYSSGGSGDCVEVALTWRKSSYSGGSGDDCVEIAPCPAAIHVRDSKNAEGPQLALEPRAWAHFVGYASRG
ncbi:MULTISPECIES: DUF397 domain-containing protein [Streptomyces]|uniref:DUF397 domain-containing protein n=1 Tax=Streptomyces TaxID=1883 RepID=UPI001E631EAF|nr:MULTISPECIES: DUF397 domain-containing protein [Streptomyces]UFQ18966.1 DUF397 domain-containing protein [Streptomyces huasconensis]WCL88585.1 DUF397 domain-containing protein [Streptomyces sp. JCM 35825]